MLIFIVVGFFLLFLIATSQFVRNIIKYDILGKFFIIPEKPKCGDRVEYTEFYGTPCTGTITAINYKEGKYIIKERIYGRGDLNELIWNHRQERWDIDLDKVRENEINRTIKGKGWNKC